MKRRLVAFLMAVCCAVASLPLEALAEAVEPALEAPVETEVPAEETEAPVETEVPAEETEAPAETEVPAEETEAPVETEVPAEETETPVETEVPAEKTEAPDETEVPAEKTEAPDETEVPVEETETPETTEMPTATENPIDYTKNASFSPTFHQGYAEVLEDDAETLPDSGERFLLPEKLIVYVEERDAQDHLLIWLDTLDGRLAGWTDSVNLRPLSEEETAAFVEMMSREADVRFLDDEKKVPLARTDAVKFPDSAEEEAQTPEMETAQEVSAAAVQMNVEQHRTVLKGETFRIEPTYSDGAERESTCTISDETVVCRAEDGAFVAIQVGEALLTFESALGSAVCTVRVESIEPEWVKLPYDTLSIGVGEKVQLEPDVGSAITTFEYATSNKKVATVSKDGVIKGVKKGSAKIRVKTYNGKEVIIAVKVYKAPSKVTASAKKLTLGVGETATVGYKLPSSTMGSVTFASSDSTIAIVDAKTGEVSALKAGTAKIQIKTYNGKKAYTTIEVKNAPQSVSVSPETAVVGVGQTISLSANVNSGAAGSMSWSSADGSVAVCADGSVKGVQVGMTQAIATAYNGVSGSCEVRVVAAPEQVTLPYSTLYLGVGEKVQLSPEAGEIVEGFSYATSNKKVATVSKDGVIKGVKKGSAKIRVKTYNGKEVIINVKVCTAPKKVTASVQKLELGVGETATISYKLPSGTASAVTFASSNESIVRVDAKTGVVTAVQPGQAIVRVRTFNNKKADCTVTVYAAPEKVTLNVSSLELGEGQSFQLSPSIDAQCRATFAYSASDSSVVEVSEKGLLKAVGKGSATVRVQTQIPEVWAEATVNVLPAPESVTLETQSLRIQVGETYQMNPVVPEGSFAQLTFASSNEKVASVSADGLVTALSRGTATLTASACNGKSAKLEVTVWDPNAPTSIELTNIPEYIRLEDGKYAMEYSVEPSGGKPQLNWSSSDPSVATVDSNGVISPKSYGYTKITAASAQDASVQAQFTLTVQTAKITLVIPARTTQESGISANLAKIDNIRASAIAQVEALKNGGVISSADASKRKTIINNIFKDYAFPWKTTAYQKYWKAANSEGGAKDFRIDRVYYGMPYTSGSSTNRRYNSAKALSESRFTDSGNGYYLLNRSKLLNGSYVGNDCSALVNMAIWGVSSSHSYDRTTDIASSSAYKTIKDYKSMRPGDLLCKSGSHVVMFLYYANAEKTKIMIIENGGEEAGTNTVHCAVHSLSYYTGKGYKVRRLSSLG